MYYNKLIIFILLIGLTSVGNGQMVINTIKEDFPVELGELTLSKASLIFPMRLLIGCTNDTSAYPRKIIIALEIKNSDKITIPSNTSVIAKQNCIAHNSKSV